MNENNCELKLSKIMNLNFEQKLYAQCKNVKIKWNEFKRD